MLPVPLWWSWNASLSRLDADQTRESGENLSCMAGYIASSDLGRDLEGFCLGKDLPFDSEKLLFAFQLSDVFSKFCVVLALFLSNNTWWIYIFAPSRIQAPVLKFMGAERKNALNQYILIGIKAQYLALWSRREDCSTEQLATQATFWTRATLHGAPNVQAMPRF